ncbi:hypothetical protein AVME950_00525 [Acidovorax sp. SUPP950]|uniref:hypothetical protein n=1 Tax=Acidovorax sp. SUPP950 TaxID=511901 RepID=UPI0023CE89C2|nr:hypothetical protein [Acidovorax sp. SUPP950]GKS73323.1 hypothetical protein AVME950_00525 [Acidovorax sp. SUPP950]
MNQKFDEYGPALTALVEEAIRCSPESWEKGNLTIDCDGSRINYRLKNLDSSEKAQISAELARLCERYWTSFEQHGEAWIEANVEFFKKDGNWGFRSNQKFPEAAVTAPTKPTWKFWH